MKRLGLGLGQEIHLPGTLRLAASFIFLVTTTLSYFTPKNRKSRLEAIADLASTTDQLL